MADDLEILNRVDQKHEKSNENVESQERLAVSLMTETRDLPKTEAPKLTFEQITNDRGALSSLKTSDGRSFVRIEDENWTMKYRAGGQDKSTSVSNVEVKEGKLNYDVQTAGKTVHVTELSDGSRLVAPIKDKELATTLDLKKGRDDKRSTLGWRANEDKIKTGDDHKKDTPHLMSNRGDAVPQQQEKERIVVDRNSEHEVRVPQIPTLQVPGLGQTESLPPKEFSTNVPGLGECISTAKHYKDEEGLSSCEVTHVSEKGTMVEKRVENTDGSFQGTITTTDKNGSSQTKHYTESKFGTQTFDVEQSTTQGKTETKWVADGYLYGQSEKGLSRSWRGYNGDTVSELWKDGRIVERTKGGTKTSYDYDDNGKIKKETEQKGKETTESFYSPPGSDYPSKSIRINSETGSKTVSEFQGSGEGSSKTYNAEGKLTERSEWKITPDRTERVRYDADGKKLDYFHQTKNETIDERSDSNGKPIYRKHVNAIGVDDDKWDEKGRLTEHKRFREGNSEHSSYDYDDEKKQIVVTDHVKGNTMRIAQEKPVEGFPTDTESGGIKGLLQDKLTAGGKVYNQSDRPIAILINGHVDPKDDYEVRTAKGKPYIYVLQPGERVPDNVDADGIIVDKRYQPVKGPDGIWRAPIIPAPAEGEPPVKIAKVENNNFANVSSFNDDGSINTKRMDGKFSLDEGIHKVISGGQQMTQEPLDLRSKNTKWRKEREEKLKKLDDENPYRQGKL